MAGEVYDFAIPEEKREQHAAKVARLNDAFAFRTPDRLPLRFSPGEGIDYTKITDVRRRADGTPIPIWDMYRPDWECFDGIVKGSYEAWMVRQEPILWEEDFLPQIGTPSPDDCVPTLFGVGWHWDDDDVMAFDWHERSIIPDVDALERWIADPPEVDVKRGGIMGHLHDKIAHLAAHSTNVPIGYVDHQGPMANLSKLMPPTLLMMAALDRPDVVEAAHSFIADVMIAMMRHQHDLTGGRRMSGNMPDEADGLVYDDFVSVVSPDLHDRVARGPNDRILAAFGGGHLHTCGPILGGPIEALKAYEHLTSVDVLKTLSGSPVVTAAEILEAKRQVDGAFLLHLPAPTDLNEFTVDFVRAAMDGGGLLLFDNGTLERRKAMRATIEKAVD